MAASSSARGSSWKTGLDTILSGPPLRIRTVSGALCGCGLMSSVCCFNGPWCGYRRRLTPRVRRPRQRPCDVSGIIYHRSPIVSQRSLDYDSVSTTNTWRPSAMSLTELFPAIKMLARADQLRLMQFLVIDLAQEEGIPLLSADAEYPIWTPLNAFEAADTLLQMLQTHQADT